MHYLSIIILISPLLVLVQSSRLLLKEPFADDSYLEAFNLQCSYNDVGCKRHFALTKESETPFLLINISPKDIPHTPTSQTSPRSELALRKSILAPGVEYQITWNVNILHYPAGYAFCFMQAFDGMNGPNVMFKWIRNRYELWANQRRIILAGTLAEDLNQISTWKVTLLLHSENGYVIVDRKRSSESHFRRLG